MPWRSPPRRSWCRATGASKPTRSAPISRSARRAARRRQGRRRRQGAVCDRPVPGRAAELPGRPAGRHGGRESRSSAASSSRATSASRTSSSPRKSSRSRAARCRARRCSPTSSASSTSTAATAAMTSRVDAEDHRPPEQPRRPGVRDQRGRQDHRQGDHLRRQSRLFQLAPEGRHQDLAKQHPELPQDQQSLRSRPRRVGPRPVAPLVPEERLCRRADRLGGRRIRSRAGRASSSPSRSRKASTTASARSTSSRTCATSIPARCAASCASLPGGTYNAEDVEKSIEEMTIELSKRGYAFAQVRPRGDRNYRDAPDLDRVRGRGGRARLYRADQCARQHPHARLRDPARVRYRGGRRLQPRAGRPRGTAAEEPRLLQVA